MTDLRLPPRLTPRTAIQVRNTSFGRIDTDDASPEVAQQQLVRIDFLGVPIDCCNMDTVVELTTTAMRHRKRLQHGDINVAKFIDCRTDPEFRRYTAESDIICPDGMGIVWGCQLMGFPVRERVPGIDLMMRVIDVCALEGFRPYFFGAKQEVLEKAIAEVRRRCPRLEIAGWRNGYFSPEDEAGIVAAIRASRADCLFVGISSPIKEKFLNRNRDAFNVPAQLGVGGSFDVLAKEVPRAPVWLQRSGFEWLFRLSHEPQRLAKRYMKTNAQFAAILASELSRGLLMKYLWPMGTK